MMNDELYEKARNAIYNGKSFSMFYLSLMGEYDRREAKAIYDRVLDEMNQDAEVNDGEGYGEDDDNTPVELNESSIRKVISNIMYNL